MSYIIPMSKVAELGVDVDAVLSPKQTDNIHTVTLTIDKTMIEDVNFARLYNHIVRGLIKDDINARDTARSTEAS